MASENKASLKIHVDLDTKSKLDQYATRLNVSINWLCVQAINEYLDTLPPVDVAEIRIVIANGD